ncbi:MULTISPECIES: hypothetical protein [unclassified Microcoleus]
MNVTQRLRNGESDLPQILPVPHHPIDLKKTTRSHIGRNTPEQA